MYGYDECQCMPIVCMRMTFLLLSLLLSSFTADEYNLYLLTI